MRFAHHDVGAGLLAAAALGGGLSASAVAQTFLPVETYTIPANPAHVIAADFTGDGRLDVGVACRVLSATQGQVGILVQNVGGTLNAVSTRTWPLVRRPEHLNAMNINFSGPIDLVVADGSGPLVALHSNGTGNIGAWQENEDLTLFYQVGEGANQSTGFIINTIANALIATGVGTNGRLHARVGDGDGTYEGFFQTPEIELGNGAFPMARGRLDSGPLEDDLVVCISTSNIVKVFMYKGFVMCSDICWRGYTYAGACPLGPGETAPPDVVVGSGPIGVVLDHFNPAADAHTDMAVLCSGDNTVRVFRGNGNGTFVATQTISVGSPVRAIASGDLNRDNRADLVVAVDPAAGNGSVRVYINNGSGTFSLGPVLTVPVDPTSVALADVSGDGLRDVIATSQNGPAGNLLVFRNSSPAACLANFDGVGGVQVNDIFAFLTAWFAGFPAADLNQNGSNDVPDIFQFLTLWFAGCP
ncbi:MAG: VCBS repeat-containing protein [Phycisphaeraceae bacterium]|nr:VCBS repeat-containing protein [Phycisphaeraceae bacterium]MBX3405388.1 VCBS repeat-containing protein [Phycisphaeraceae bacterium]